MKNFFTALYYSLSDPKAYYSFQKEMQIKAFEHLFMNSFAGLRVFRAVVLPQDTSSPDSLSSQTGGSKAIRVRPLDLHEFILPEPCSSKKKDIRKKIISMHPIAYPDSSFPIAGGNIEQSVPVATGMIVEIKFDKGPMQGFLRGLVYKKTNSYSRTLDLSCFGDIDAGLKSAFENPSLAQGPNTSQTNRNDPFNGQHKVQRMERRIKVKQGTISGVGDPTAARNAIEEIAFWVGKDEKDAGEKGKNNKKSIVYKRIQLYHYYKKQQDKKIKKKDYRKLSDYESNYQTDKEVAKTYIGGSAKSGTGDSTTGIMHWSATSISWVMRNSEFPATAGHTDYTSRIINGSYPKWEAHSLLRERVKAQLGDVLIRTGGHGRKNKKTGTDTTLTASHGDVVYKIEGGFAHIAGGNIGSRGKFIEARKLKLNPDGTYYDISSKSGDYLIVLKKMK